MNTISGLAAKAGEAFHEFAVKPILNETFVPTNSNQDLALPAPTGTVIEDISLHNDGESTKAVVYVPDGKVSLAIVGYVGLNHDPTQQAHPFIDAAKQVGDVAVVIASSRNMAGGPQTDGYARFGAAEEADDLMDVERWARTNVTPNIALGGFSHGGAVAAARLDRHSAIPVKGMLLGAPALDIGAAIRTNAPRELRNMDNSPRIEFALNHAPWITDPLISLASRLGTRKAEQILGIPPGTLNYPKRLKHQPLPPTLVMHSPNDEWIPFNVSAQFQRQHPDEVTLVRMEGHGHDREWNNNHPFYASEMSVFLREHILPTI